MKIMGISKYCLALCQELMVDFLLATSENINMQIGRLCRMCIHLYVVSYKASNT